MHVRGQISVPTLTCPTSAQTSAPLHVVGQLYAITKKFERHAPPIAARLIERMEHELRAERPSPHGVAKPDLAAF